MIEMLSNIFGIVCQWLKYKNSPLAQRKQAKSELQDKKEKARNQNNAIRFNVRNHNKDEINKMLSKCAIISAGICTAIAFCSGCIAQNETVVYVPADREVYPLTNNVGTTGWFVPDTVMEELLINKKELEDLKLELETEKRIK